MILRLAFLPTIVFVAVMLCWFTFAGIFLFRKKPFAAPEIKRESRSLFGLALQGLAYAIVWAVHRQSFTPPFRVILAIEIAIAVSTIVIAVVSIWLLATAVHTLGKEWSVTARLVEGHKLITAGPYRFVRNPIYTAMFGILLATGLAISQWPALIGAVLVFAIGTWLRILSEEKLLREGFGPEFEAYARSVPALVPRLSDFTTKSY
ncbi:MAG: isoprenylcysteine carboxylmethyltransferase family protein [Pyrinomonadaceae bacterium]